MTDDEWTDWIEHDGGECPVPEFEAVKIKLISGIENWPRNAGEYRWQNKMTLRDNITHYKRRKSAVAAEKTKATSGSTDWSKGSGWTIPEGQAVKDCAFIETELVRKGYERGLQDRGCISQEDHDRRVSELLASNNAMMEQIGGDHYKKLGAYQPWEVLRRWLTPEEFRGYMKGTAIAYLARERDKGGDEDIAKAAHTLQALLEMAGRDT